MRPSTVVVQGRSRVGIGLALAAVYLVWGSTYLGIRFAVETLPPFSMGAVRFLIAGALVYGFGRVRRFPDPTPRQWWNCLRVGALLMVGGFGAVTLAESLGIGSGLTATMIAATPLWAMLFAGLFGERPHRREWLGLAVGMAGVAVLSQEGDFQATPAGLVLLVMSPVFWAFGSMWSKRLDLPNAVMTNAAEMLGGAAGLTMMALVLGERPDTPSTSSLVALAYLIFVGTLVGFSAFQYLLHRVRPSIATSYAYVNPVVALILGVTVGRERLTGSVFLALPLIAVGLALVATARAAETV